MFVIAALLYFRSQTAGSSSERVACAAQEVEAGSSCRRTSSRCRATKALVGIECGPSFLLTIAPLASVQEPQLRRNIQELEAFITVLTN